MFRVVYRIKTFSLPAERGFTYHATLGEATAKLNSVESATHVEVQTCEGCLGEWNGKTLQCYDDGHWATVEMRG